MKRLLMLSFFLLLSLSLFCVPIKIKTIPGNTSVYIDNTLFGITNRTGMLSEMLFLNKGEYIFGAEKPGYNRVEKTVLIEEATSVVLKLVPSGVLKVSAFPDDSQITVDERFKSEGFFEKELPVGKHYVYVEKEGFIPRAFYVDIKQYSKKALDVTLNRDGKTEIVSDPSKAQVSVDGQVVGETPLETYLEPGEHIITFHKKWYYSETRNITVKNRETTKVNQVLTPYAHLTVEASPAETTVILDGLKKSPTPVSFKELETGKHQLVFGHPGYVSKEKEIFLEPGENRVSETLSLKEYEWTFESTPAAVVVLDGRELGLTPFKKLIEHGEHIVHLSSGEKEWKTRINVVAPGKTAVDLNRETTVCFDVIPTGQSFVVHKGMEYDSPAIINTIYGLQTFDIVRGGYPVRRRMYKLLPGVIYEYSINLEGESEIFLTSKPAGAAVYWMGTRIGKTPLRGIKVRPGTGTLRLEWKDGAEWTEKRTFSEGDTYSIYREIPSRTVLNIYSFPNELEIYLDGKKSGVTPVVLRLKQGVYNITCQNKDGKTQEKVITLSGEKERTINFVF